MVRMGRDICPIGGEQTLKGLVTNYGEVEGGGGGATKREGRHVKFYPYERGRGEF